MPNRILREGILTSERVAKLSWPAEVFYRRLMSVVDDFGRYYAKPELLRSAAYPLTPDKVGNSDIGKWLAECAGAALVRTYAVDGKHYLELLDFRQQVRAKESKFPDPPSTCEADSAQMHSRCIADAHLDGDGDVVEDVVDKGSSEAAQNPRSSKPPPRRKPALQGWKGEPVVMMPVVGNGGSLEVAVRSDYVDELQAAYPSIDVPQTLREMRAWCLSNPGRRKTPSGVPAFINRWLAKEQNRG